MSKPKKYTIKLDLVKTFTEPRLYVSATLSTRDGLKFKLVTIDKSRTKITTAFNHEEFMDAGLPGFELHLLGFEMYITELQNKLPGFYKKEEEDDFCNQDF